ncbi:MAG: hypothetical protein ACRC1T_17605 [Clostridium chrysemydis]|uniref:hypothetical protein n=1 Tax=Clostridium chrysemydis TaxID=2665504 RepID=UPI003F407E08
MTKEPFDFKRLFVIAKTQLNYSEDEFLNSSFKRVVDLVNTLNQMLSEENNEEGPINNEGYKEVVVNIADAPF